MSMHRQPAPLEGRAAGRLLVVDDEPIILKSLERLFSRAGHETFGCSSARDAIDAFRQRPFDVVVSDVRMPGMDGVELTSAIHALAPHVPIILLTGDPQLETAQGALARGAFRYLTKPVDAALLRSTVATAVGLSEIHRQRADAMRRVGDPDAPMLEHMQLELRFQSALDQMYMAYQPIVSWAKREVLAYEGLLRTRESSLANPALLLDVAEQLDRVGDVSQLVLSRVARPFLAQGKDALIFVNLHSTDLANDQLVSSDSPLAPIADRVVFEITERVSIDGIADVRARVKALRDAGFRIALDDIGAGYAGLSSFATLEPDVVKIDMSLVRDVDKLPTKQKLVRTLVALCRDCTQFVVAEGVETPEERDCLVALGVDIFQGYLFAKPGNAFPEIHWDVP